MGGMCFKRWPRYEEQPRNLKSSFFEAVWPCHVAAVSFKAFNDTKYQSICFSTENFSVKIRLKFAQI